MTIVRSAIGGAAGAQYAAPVVLAGGAPLASVFVVEWVGPFDPAQWDDTNGGVGRTMLEHQETTVSTGKLAQLQSSDPAWWQQIP